MFAAVLFRDGLGAFLFFQPFGLERCPLPFSSTYCVFYRACSSIFSFLSFLTRVSLRNFSSGLLEAFPGFLSPTTKGEFFKALVV